MTEQNLKKLLIETPVDKLVILAKQKRGIAIPEAARLLGASEQQVEEWARILEERGLLKLVFPMVGQPKIVPAFISQAKLSKKIEEFAQRKAQIEILAQNYMEKSREAERHLSVKFVPVEEELYARLKDVEGSIKSLNILKGMEKKMEADIADFEKKKAEISGESEELEKRSSQVMKNINTVESSSQDLAADIAEALSDMQKKERNVKILSEEQKNIEKELSVLHKEIRMVSALAGGKSGKWLAGKLSGLFGKKRRKRRIEMQDNPSEKAHEIRKGKKVPAGSLSGRQKSKALRKGIEKKSMTKGYKRGKARLRKGGSRK